MSEYQVFGHQNPDTDTIMSSLVAVDYFKQTQNMDIEAIALGEINEETAFVLNYLNIDAPTVLENATAEKVILVDHNEFSQTTPNISEKTITHIFDHHKVNLNYSNPIFIHTEELGSAASILYKFYLQNEITPSKSVAGMLASAIISDTLLLKSPTTTSFEVENLPKIAELAGIDDLEKYGLDLLKAGTNLDNKSEKELIDGDAKTFEMNGKNVRIGQVNTVDIDSVFKRSDAIEQAIKSEMYDQKYDDFIFVVTDILNSNSRALYFGDDSELIKKALNGNTDDNIIDLPGVVSRKKQVVPVLQESFEQ